MQYSRDTFYRAVCVTVESIPVGCVMAYVDVARRSGYPRHVRLVSRVLKFYGDRIPWHRVLRSDGTSAFDLGSESYQIQKRRLEAEGVKYINGRFVAKSSQIITTNLDMALWSQDD